MIRKRKFEVTLGLVTLLVLVFDALFKSELLGINVGIFLVALQIGQILVARKSHSQVQLGLHVMSAIQILSVMLRPTALNIGLAVAFEVALSIIRRLPPKYLVTRSYSLLIWIVPSIGLQTVRDLRNVFSFRARHPQPNCMKQIIRDWRLPVLGASLFGILFVVANPVLELYCYRALDSLVIHFPDLSVGRTFLLTLATIVIWGLLRFKVSLPLPTSAVNSRRREQRSALEIQRCLILFNLVFALQTIVDSRYLWAQRSLPKGISYAAFAHHGAYGLLFAAALAAAAILYIPTEYFHNSNATKLRILLHAWLAQNLFLIASAARRLSMYTAMYGLTILRFNTYLWLIIVGMGFLLIGAQVITQKSRRWLVERNAIAALVVLSVAGYLDIAKIVANYNLGASTIDASTMFGRIQYSHDLGPDALPALKRYIVQQNAGPSYSNVAAKAEAEKIFQALQVELQQRLADWRTTSLTDRLIASDIELN